MSATATMPTTKSVAEQLGIDVEMPPETLRKRFHVGIRCDDGHPIAWALTLGGVCFPVTSSKYDAEGNEFKREGEFVDLDEETLRRIATAVKHRVYRWRRNSKGEKTSCEVWDIRQKGFKLAAGDRPLHEELIFRPVTKEESTPSLRPSALAEIEKALESIRVVENEAQHDPADKLIREKHKRARETGARLEEDGV